MQKRPNSFLLLFLIIAVVMISAVPTRTVYADDGGTDPVTEESAPPAEGEETAPDETPPTEEPAVNEAGDTEPLPTEDSTEIIATEPIAEEPTPVTEILEQLPEDTALVVVNEAGEAEPLATTQAAEIIATGDPIWCPASVTTPAAHVNGCTNSHTSFADLIAELADPAYTGDGIVWVAYDYNGADNAQIAFEGDTLTNLSSSNLTIQGGWDPSDNSVDPATPSQLDVSLVVTFWSGNVTIKNIDISNTTDDAGFGLYIDNNGDVTLDNVSVTDTPANTSGFGDGAILNTTGIVSISNSEFDRNTGNGLTVESGGTITLNTVSASNNTLTGAYLDSCRYGSAIPGLCAGTGAITITSAASNLFNGNGFNGLSVDAGGGIAIINTFAGNNDVNGAQLMSADDNGTGDVMVVGSDFIGNANGTGLDLFTGGNIELYDVYALSNNTGAFLTTTYGTGTIYVEDSSFGFAGSGNNWTGLHAESGSTITLTAMEASDNGTNGAYLVAEGDITVAGSFNGNVKFGAPEDPGLYAWSNGGNITLNYSAANDNVYGAGVVLNTRGSGVITVNGGQFNGNGTFGIQSRVENGGITLDGVTASENQVKGAYLESYGLGNIFVNDSTFNFNGVNGLRIIAGGQVNLVNVTADQNGGNGVEVYSISTAEPICMGEQPVNITVNVDDSTFTNNGGYGLTVKPGPEGTLVFLTPSIFSPNNTLGDYLIDLSQEFKDCTPKPEDKPSDSKEPKVVEMPATGGTPVEQDCDRFSSTILKLPNGTWVKVGCPYEGFSNLEELAKENLPSPLGAGTNFVSGITVGLTDGEGKAIFNEDGTVTINFAIPNDSRARAYSILFWDPTLNDGKGGWVELPLYEVGTTFPLHPEDPDDARTILSGVKQVGDLITVTVNFPGVFILTSR